MSQQNQDEIIRQQKEEIEKLQKENRKIRENQQEQMRQIKEIKQQAEKEREAEKAEMFRLEYQRQHENGSISYLQDQRCATCEHFDCSRNIQGEPPRKPELNATNGFCKANDDRNGEISPATCCAKWEKWSEIERFEAAYKQKEQKIEDERTAKEEYERQQKEKSDRFNSAVNEYNKKVNKFKTLLIIPIIVAIVAVAISGIVYISKLTARNSAERSMNAWTELGHSLTDTYGIEYVQKYNSACENVSSALVGFIVTLVISVIVIIVAVSFWMFKRKRIDTEKPQKSDFGG